MLSRNYDQVGRPIEKVRLLNYIVERQWAIASAPALYEEIADQADMIGDTAFAVKTLRTMLRKYPTHPRKQNVMEHLGALLFSDSKYSEVRQTLGWLLGRKERAHKPDSYYFLGKSLWKLDEYPSSIKAFDRFFENAPPGNGYLPDAYYTAAAARESSGDRVGALKLLDKGLVLGGNKQNEAMLYKAGQLHLQAGSRAKGKDYLEQVAKRGKDPDWQRLAQQALESADLTSREEKK
jgi:tetratricopeptide (TPR) repeat protein